MRKPKIQNLSMKVLALGLSLLLWFYVGIEKNPFEARTIQVPVTIENLAEDLKAEMMTKQVGVTIRARADRLRNVSSDDLTATIDMSKAKLGDNAYPVTVKGASNILISKVSPDEITVSVSKSNGKHFEVEVEETGELKEGLSLEGVAVDPKTVFIAGDEASVNRVVKVVAILDLETLNESGSIGIPITLKDKDGNVVNDSGLDIRKNEVTVRYRLKENGLSKRVPITPIFTGKLSDGFTMSKYKLEPVAVEITGAKEKLDKINEIRTEEIDISGLSSNMVLSARLVVPDGITLKQETAVKIQLDIAEGGGSNNEKENTLPIQIEGGSESQNVILDPQQVVVRYRSRNDQDASSIVAKVNVNGLVNGLYQLNIDVTSQEDIEIISIAPESANVTIQPK